jgi:pimeloyl-ACP methyl ester carboxylesterase
VSAPDTIVLIHGFWVTPRSWEHWKARYESQGFTVHTPAYPGFEVEVEALRADPTPIEELTANKVVDHLSAFLDSLDVSESKPILMGHSAGGAFTQVLLDHGYGCAGVTMNSAPTEGIRATPWTQLHSVFPVLKNPLNHHRAVGFTADQWKYAFANTYTDEESLAFYERYHIPASGRVLFDSVLANWQPGHQDTWVDFKNPKRVPLLFLSGSEDHIMPESVQSSNRKHYKAEGTVTEQETYEGRPHLMTAGQGWEEVADRALEWALANAGWVPSSDAVDA